MTTSVAIFSGCALAPAKPAPEPERSLVSKIERVEIPKPYPVRCIKPENVPPVPVIDWPDTGDERAKAAAVRLWIIGSNGPDETPNGVLAYIARADALLRQCALAPLPSSPAEVSP